MQRTMIVLLFATAAGSVVPVVAGPAPDYRFVEEGAPGEVDLRVVVTTDANWTAKGGLRVVCNYEDESNNLYFAADGKGARLGNVEGGKDVVLAKCGPVPELAAAGSHKVTVKRRDLSVRVLCDGRVTLGAMTAYRPGERMGAFAREATITDMSAQPIGEMMFDDDFARPPGEPNPWQVASGTWATSLPETRNRATEAAKSANPFSYSATSDQALAVAGSQYWDGYRVRVAVRTAGPGMAGLAGYVQDAKNMYLLRGTFVAPVVAAPGEVAASGKIELLKLVGGMETVLATAGAALEPDKWYEFGLGLSGSRLVGTLDGVPVVEAADKAFGEGRIGLFADKCAKVHFDDVNLGSLRSFTENWDGPPGLGFAGRDGKWTVSRGRLHGFPSKAKVPTTALIGPATWQDYRFSSQMKVGSAVAAGLIFACSSDADYKLFRWGPSAGKPSETVQELWGGTGGQRTLLASRVAPLNRKLSYAVAVTANRSYLGVAVDGQTVLEAADTSCPSAGSVGYYVEGSADSEANFDDLQVTFCDLPTEPTSVVDQFAKEDTMADWARPMASWAPLGGRVYAYALPAWGDFVLRIPLRTLVGHDGSVAVRLAATTAELATVPAALEVVGTKDKPELTCTVVAGSGGSGALAPEGEDALLEVERLGGVLVARMDGQAFAWARAVNGATAPMVGLALSGLGADLNEATVSSPRILDTTFGNAPTGWLPQTGTWEISDRWNCQPQWSWFCGRNAEAPVIWSKRNYTGDMVMEFWAGMMMDMAGGPGYSHPSDINCLMSGDGQDLKSGYAFVFAGERNTKTQILRKGQVVAETPDFRFTNPSSGGDLNAFHRHWFHSRVEKTGGHIDYYIDGRKALSYDDPEPLNTGRIGFFTQQNNGIMIARVRVSHR